jgi:hypothetical protein
LTVDLADVKGVHQAFSVVLPVRLPAAPSWVAGPIPFELGARRTDAAVRQTYFTPAAGRALYAHRWHSFSSVSDGPLRLDGMEVLRTGTDQGASQEALAVLHFTVSGRCLLPVLRAIGHRPSADPDPLVGRLSPEVLLDGVAELLDASAPFAIARPYTVAFLTPDAAHGPALRDSAGVLPVSADEWLWRLASRSERVDFPTTHEHTARVTRDAIRISADWSALVLRHGAAFLGHRADEGPGDFYEFGALHARTVYLDALLLGMVQRDHINQLTEDLSAIFEGPGLARRVAGLEGRIALFRSTYWRQHLTAHGAANDLLVSFQAQHRLPARFTEILAEAGDYSRLVQTQESQQIAGALGVLTILGLPLGTALSILQVLGDQDAGDLVIALAAAFGATAAALTTRYGRLVLASLRGSRRR